MPRPKTHRRYASFAEAAAHIGVNPRTIRRWMLDGRLTGYRFGPKTIKVDLDELDRLPEIIPAVAHPRRVG